MKEKKNKNKEKQRSSILEIVLVIVIVILLLGLLVPTCCNVIEQKNQKGDMQIVRYLNQALNVDSEQHQITKHSTMFDANEVTKKAGFDVGKIVSTSNLDIAWDSQEDRFVLLDTKTAKYIYVVDDNTNKTSNVDQKERFFVARQNLNDMEIGYSIYAREDWNGERTITITTGFDCGSQYFEKITYNRQDATTQQEVIIRTNSLNTDLIINAPMDTIHHYDKVGSVNLIESAMSSYHEYGKVAFFEVAKGRVALENGAEVQKLHFNATPQKDFDKIIVAANPNVKLPEFSRDKANIKTNGTLVVELQKDTNNNDETVSDYIWLYKTGVISQIVVVGKQSDKIVAEKQNEETYKFYAEKANGEKVQEVVLGIQNETQSTQKAAVEIANNYVGTTTSGSITVEGKQIELPSVNSDGSLIDHNTASVEETGLTANEKVETKQSAKETSQVLEAKITDVSNPYIFEYDLLFNNNIALTAKLQKGYKFSAFNDTEKTYIDTFINAEDKNGRIFSDNISDYSNPEKVERALSVVKNEYGEDVYNLVKKSLDIRSKYFTWRADFEVSFNGDIQIGTVALAGQYDSFGSYWVGFGMSDVANGLPTTLSKGKSVRLLDTAYKNSQELIGHTIEDLHINYAAICGYVKDFSCGLTNLSADNTGKMVTIKLCLYEVGQDGNETGKRMECATINYILEAPIN